MRLKALKERIFTKLFEEAEIAKFSQQELREYEDSLKAYRDIKNSIDTAKEEGRERRRGRRYCQRKVGHRKASSRHGAHTRASCQRYRPFNRRYERLV